MRQLLSLLVAALFYSCMSMHNGGNAQREYSDTVLCGYSAHERSFRKEVSEAAGRVVFIFSGMCDNEIVAVSSSAANSGGLWSRKYRKSCVTYSKDGDATFCANGDTLTCDITENPYNVQRTMQVFFAGTDVFAQQAEREPYGHFVAHRAVVEQAANPNGSAPPESDTMNFSTLIAGDTVAIKADCDNFSVPATGGDYKVILSADCSIYRITLMDANGNVVRNIRNNAVQHYAVTRYRYEDDWCKVDVHLDTLFCKVKHSTSHVNRTIRVTVTELMKRKNIVFVQQPR